MADGLLTSDYDFDLPPERIAQTPAERRDESRLMLLDRSSGRIEHRRFRDVLDLMQPEDALIVNTTRVFRARLLGTRDSGAPAEVLLLKAVGDSRYEAMVSPGGKLKPGRVVHVAPGFDVEIETITDRRTRIVRLTSDLPVGQAIERHGHMPLPPYIDRRDEAADADRYQTVYARESGSVAAPTAGLHFTEELLRAIAKKGVRRGDVVLHVGAGTFKPVEVDDPARHLMHEEWYAVPAATADLVNEAKRSERSVWAVGTTSVRTLESASAGGTVSAGAAETRIFIRPPYRFRVVDRLITNFHLPRSTLIMLVAAFAGYDLTMRAYREAIAAGYRFYSYGDAMAIL